MSSIKCTLRKETKNEIAKYIDNEFINETIKEIVKYIKEVNKVQIDDSNYNKYDINSKVDLIDNGPFNIYDYTYVKDFLYEVSWEGSYIEDLKEIEENDDDTPVYKYEPKDIATVIYEKVATIMEQKKGELYKKFKSKYNDEFIWNSVRWYKRTRDGKVYYDLDLEELNDDKKRSIEEKIKVEIGNGFKTRWGAAVAVKVAPLEEKLLLDIYDKGCAALGIANDCYTEIVEEDKSDDEEKLIKLMIESCEEASSSTKGINRLKVKVVNSIDKRLDNLINVNIYKTKEHMNLFLEDAKSMVFGYYKSVNLPGFRRNLVSKEDKINEIIKRIAVVENILYKEYLKENEKAPSIDEMIEFKECIPWICIKGLVWTSENIYIKNKAKDEIQEIILDNPIYEYKETREMKRHFYLHVGETNTGKTHASIERLMEVETGVYLAPLRLLALEIQDKLNSENISCSLLTGEEEDIISYAGHVSSTIEKLQLGTPYDVCVIDEAQMIADKQRGWAWTRAIIGVMAPEVHICMAPEAKDVIIKLIKDCNDTYEVIEHKRDTELIFEDKKFDLNKDVKPGDALVVFGKKKALAVSAQLLNNNIKTSIIYGSLPYSTRKKQFERFLDGETEVIVCTDAIGMGVNLPIRRIIFTESKKFDGKSKRFLNMSEVKQIAGRAGRKGMYDQGYVNSIEDRDQIGELLHGRYEQITSCVIQPPRKVLDMPYSLSEIFKIWLKTIEKKCFSVADLKNRIKLAEYIEKKHGEKINKDLEYSLINIPFDENSEKLKYLWQDLVDMTADGEPVSRMWYYVDTESEDIEAMKLDDLEQLYKKMDLLNSYCNALNISEYDERIRILKEKISELIVRELTNGEFFNKCKRCGKRLEWNHRFGMCEKCYEINKLERMRYKADKWR